VLNDVVGAERKLRHDHQALERRITPTAESLPAGALTLRLHPTELRSNIAFPRRDPRPENRAGAGSLWSEEDEATGY